MPADMSTHPEARGRERGSRRWTAGIRNTRRRRRLLGLLRQADTASASASEAWCSKPGKAVQKRQILERGKPAQVDDAQTGIPEGRRRCRTFRAGWRETPHRLPAAPLLRAGRTPGGLSRSTGSRRIGENGRAGRGGPGPWGEGLLAPDVEDHAPRGCYAGRLRQQGEEFAAHVPRRPQHGSPHGQRGPALQFCGFRFCSGRRQSAPSGFCRDIQRLLNPTFQPNGIFMHSMHKYTFLYPKDFFLSTKNARW